MTTCHACGSDTVEDATCVVCGAEPTPDPAAAADEPEAWPSGADTGTDTGADTGADRGVPVRVDHGTGGDAVAAPRVPVGAGVPAGTSGPTGPAAAAGSRPNSTPSSGGHPPPPPVGGSAAPPDAPTGAPTGVPTDGPSGVTGAVPPNPDAVAVTETARNWAMVTHLSALVSAGLGGLIFLGPLLVWLVKKDEDRYVSHHATEALNFNLSMTLYAVLGVLLVFTIVGIPITILMAVIGFPLWFIASIVAAVRAQRGEGFRYPLTIRLVRE